MKVAFQIDKTEYVVEASELDVVRLVASARGISAVDVEAFPEKVSIKSDAFSVNAPSRLEACEKFIERALK